MRSSFATYRGLTLMKTPNLRQQAGRRWLTLACGLLALALASGVVGTLASSPTPAPVKSTAGPFSYFPTE